MQPFSLPLLFAACLGLIVQPLLPKNAISQDAYDDLVFYLQYAFSGSADHCPSSNGNTLVCEFVNNVTDTRGFIARDDARKEIILSHGSNGLKGVITDLLFCLTDFVVEGTDPPNGTLVHHGFLTAWNGVVDEVSSVFRSQLATHPGYSIVTTGASIGGALASLAGITLQQNFPSTTVRVYTYGQPRTGNDVYALWVNELLGSNVYRVVHEADLVPHIPPIIVDLLPYRHHGIEFWQHDPPSAENTTECAPGGEDPTCSASVFEWNATAHGVYFGISSGQFFCN
ncbi:alpha/beta-hydrolase [Stereum hirsutum FP-91666 SS1]|uniref:alpha/beta-hydrolase n=1 Tax=Stereum hirsutum (strain FP-91666) TaxID=721885 RepID=UPI000440C362|nr:alpha/beta-hydrolase [Stereum hirsutum FP-91666 SS1]EIM90596.1 alpha/beta-hydrolase [Stereum hirsutum FP-91666 SS1]